MRRKEAFWMWKLPLSVLLAEAIAQLRHMGQMKQTGE